MRSSPASWYPHNRQPSPSPHRPASPAKPAARSNKACPPPTLHSQSAISHSAADASPQPEPASHTQQSSTPPPSKHSSSSSFSPRHKKIVSPAQIHLQHQTTSRPSPCLKSSPQHDAHSARHPPAIPQYDSPYRRQNKSARPPG